MNDWQKLGELGIQEMEKFQVGVRVRLRRMFGGKIKGIIIETESPIGLLAPRYKCRWDDGDESDFLLSSNLEVLQEKNRK
jgi:hypothetical protein